MAGTAPPANRQRIRCNRAGTWGQTVLWLLSSNSHVSWPWNILRSTRLQNQAKVQWPQSRHMRPNSIVYPYHFLCAAGTPVSKPAKQAPRPVVPAGKEQLSSTNQQTPGKPDGLKPTAVPGVTAPYASLEVASPGQHPGTPSSSSPLGAGAGQ
jgi:hypothetical protein